MRFCANSMSFLTSWWSRLEIPWHSVPALAKKIWAVWPNPHRPGGFGGTLKDTIWVWVNTYRYIFSGMNIHLPAILGFTRYQGFDPSPYLDTSHKTGSQHLWILYQFIMDKTLFILWGIYWGYTPEMVVLIWKTIKCWHFFLRQTIKFWRKTT